MGSVYLWMVLITFICIMIIPDVHKTNAFIAFIMGSIMAFGWPIFWSVVLYLTITGKEI